MNEQAQLDILSLFESRFRKEYESIPKEKASMNEYYINNTSFGSVDGEILYCMVRNFKPSRIIEIGSGFSTILSAQAIMRNKLEDPTYDCIFVTIDPYPSKLLDNLSGLSKIKRMRVQEVPINEFEKLEENDILFIDSSHVLKIGSDVYFEYLDIIPRLNKGVIIHSHDIFLPAEYHKKWVLKDHIFWNEQYLLQSFLAFNDSYNILWASSYMHLKHSDKISSAFRSYNPEKTWPVSFWIQRIK